MKPFKVMHGVRLTKIADLCVVLKTVEPWCKCLFLGFYRRKIHASGVCVKGCWRRGSKTHDSNLVPLFFLQTGWCKEHHLPLWQETISPGEKWLCRNKKNVGTIGWSMETRWYGGVFSSLPRQKTPSYVLSWTPSFHFLKLVDFHSIYREYEHGGIG